MKIAVISTPFVAVPPPRYGGTELVVAALVEGLTARGHKVTLYATGDSRARGAELKHLYAKAIWPPQPIQELDHAAFACRDIRARGDFDVVHAHVPAALALAGFIDTPMVYTIHHARDEALGGFYRQARATFVAISERQRELLGPELAPSAHVVHHGLDADRYALGPGGDYAAFLGRFAEEKGPHVAIDVAAEVGIELRLAGRPHPKDQEFFEAQVEHRLEQPNVVWVGEVGQRAKVELLGGAVATLCPLGWEEPFGLVMIESMLCGAPVLAFPRGSAPEIIDPGVTGFIVRDADEMVWQLRELRSGRATFDRARCRDRAARRFSVARMTEAYLDIYDLVSGRAEVEAAATWPAT